MPFTGRRMETKRLLELIDECADLGVFDLTLAGGEPLLHPDILDIVSRATDQGIRVGLLTNGVLLDTDMLNELARRTNTRNFLVQVSIDSVDPSINDITRGCTDQVAQNIRNASDVGIELQIACVLSKANIANAHEIINAFYPSVKRFHFLNIQRTTSALKHSDLLLDEKEALMFWLRLNEHKKRFPDDLFLPSLRLQLRAGELTKQAPEYALKETATFDCSSCSAGWTHINIDAAFNVLGCDIAKDFTFMGNLQNKSIQDIWHSDLAAKVRDAKYPACYNIKNAEGAALRDNLRPEYVNIAPLLETTREPLRRRQ
jgi:MoaA/NifB/PqqE/SkfB family radical SAM enzyme